MVVIMGARFELLWFVFNKLNLNVLININNKCLGFSSSGHCKLLALEFLDIIIFSILHNKLMLKECSIHL